MLPPTTMILNAIVGGFFLSKIWRRYLMWISSYLSQFDTTANVFVLTCSRLNFKELFITWTYITCHSAFQCDVALPEPEGHGCPQSSVDHSDGQFFSAMEWLMFFFQATIDYDGFSMFLTPLDHHHWMFLEGPTIGLNGFFNSFWNFEDDGQRWFACTIAQESA